MTSRAVLRQIRAIVCVHNFLRSVAPNTIEEDLLTLRAAAEEHQDAGDDANGDDPVQVPPARVTSHRDAVSQSVTILLLCRLPAAGRLQIACGRNMKLTCQQCGLWQMIICDRHRHWRRQPDDCGQMKGPEWVGLAKGRR